jgi:hypothetical protein
MVSTWHEAALSQKRKNTAPGAAKVAALSRFRQKAMLLFLTFCCGVTLRGK